MQYDTEELRTEIARTWDLFLGDGNVRELRAFNVKPSEFEDRGWYYAMVDNKESALAIVEEWTKGKAKGIYFTFNPIRRSLIDQPLNTSLRSVKGTQSSDQHVLERHWILVDVDPRRPPDTSATDAQQQIASVVSRRIAEYLKGEGWPLPVMCSSGNGVHLMYRADPKEEYEPVLSKFLNALASVFEVEEAGIDLTVFNPSRVTRFYGTLARKGEATVQRPHRMSHIIYIPPEIKSVSLAQVEEVCKLLPEEPLPDVADIEPQIRFEQLDYWIRKHKLEDKLRGPITYQKDGRKWLFKVCPYNEQHKDDSAFIIQWPTGAIYAGCLHINCPGHDKGWEQLKKKFGPLKSKKRISPEEAAKIRLGTGEGFHNSPQGGSSADIEDYNRLPVIPATIGTTAAAPAGSLSLSDMGNARRFAILNGEDCRYVSAWEKWYVWNGVRWAEDIVNHIDSRCKAATLAIRAEALTTSTQQLSEQTLKWALNSQSAGRISAMKSLARSEHPVAATADIWDSDPLALNLKNGLYHLGRGELLEHDRNYLCIKICPVDYVADAECPSWLAFLNQIMQGNQEVITYLQRLVGYCLTGDTTEHAMFFCVGSGANGKSTFLNVLRSLMGTYAKISAPELLTVAKAGQSKHPSGVADLFNTRLVVCQESEKGNFLSEGLVKQLTGEEAIKARFMHQDWFEFKATHKLVMATNHRPIIRGADNGIWRRVQVIPFDVTIAKEDQDPDLHIKLTKELPGILNWAIEGYYMWRAGGLQAPETIVGAVTEYRETMDLLSDFLKEYCYEAGDAEASLEDLYDTYVNYCMLKNDTHMKRRTFSATMEERNYRKKRAASGMVFAGIGLLSAPMVGES